MTGFSKVDFTCNGVAYSLEIYSLNSRFMEVSLSLPYKSLELEHTIRGYIAERLKRGSIKVVIRPSSLDTELKRLASAIVAAYKNLKEATRGLGAPEPSIGDAVSLMPFLAGMLKDSGLSWECLEPQMQRAIERLKLSQEEEAKKLLSDINHRIVRIKELTEGLRKAYENWYGLKKAELLSRLKELPSGIADSVDAGSIVSEFLGKGDITEEIVRLDSHTKRLMEILKQDSPVGKKVVFLLQEMHREANTIGSKSSCKEIIDMVVDIKAELERIREQAQNLL